MALKFKQMEKKMKKMKLMIATALLVGSMALALGTDSSMTQFSDCDCVIDGLYGRWQNLVGTGLWMCNPDPGSCGWEI